MDGFWVERQGWLEQIPAAPDEQDRAWLHCLRAWASDQHNSRLPEQAAVLLPGKLTDPARLEACWLVPLQPGAPSHQWAKLSTARPRSKGDRFFILATAALTTAIHKMNALSIRKVSLE